MPTFVTPTLILRHARRVEDDPAALHRQDDPYRTLLSCPRLVEGCCWLPYCQRSIYTSSGVQNFPRPTFASHPRSMQAPSPLTSRRPWQADDERCRLLLFPHISSKSLEMSLLPVIPRKLASKSSVRGQCPASTDLVQESCTSHNFFLIWWTLTYLIKILRPHRCLRIRTKRGVAEKCLLGRCSAVPSNRCAPRHRPRRNTR